LPDPCDRNCPAEFKKKARPLLSKVQGTPDADDQSLRKALLSFIATFSHWDTSANAQYLEVARNLVKAAYGDEALLVVDPFAGGGAIPLEALRVGCDALAGEINPVACLILKVLLDDIPRHGQELADALTKAGEGIQKVAEKELIQTH
jgi:adenine-specific DNA methylase